MSYTLCLFLPNWPLPVLFSSNLVLTSINVSGCQYVLFLFWYCGGYWTPGDLCVWTNVPAILYGSEYTDVPILSKPDLFTVCLNFYNPLGIEFMVNSVFENFPVQPKFSFPPFIIIYMSIRLLCLSNLHVRPSHLLDTSCTESCFLQRYCGYHSSACWPLPGRQLGICCVNHPRSIRPCT